MKLLAAFIVFLVMPATLEHKIEHQFAFVQATWDYSEGQWCVTGQRRGSSDFVGACSPTLNGALRRILKKGRNSPSQ